MRIHGLSRTPLLAMAMIVVSLHLAGKPTPGQELDPEHWQVSITPYFWFSGIDGDVRVAENEADVDIGFDDIWDAFDFGGQVYLEAQKGRFGLLADLTYLSLSADRELNVADGELDIENWIVELGGFYRLGDWSSGAGFPITLDALAGGRYWNQETDLDIGPLSRESDTDWVDPFVGLRWIAQLNDWLLLFIRADVGGFAVYDHASEFTWNIQGGPGVKLSEKMTLVLAYRALNIDKEEGDDFKADLTFEGPQIGLYIRF